jgi:hypothetical protein
MQADDVKMNMRVLYTGKDKFGLRSEHTDTEFNVISRSYDHGGGGDGQWLFLLRNDWNEERWNVPAYLFEPVEDEDG